MILKNTYLPGKRSAEQELKDPLHLSTIAMIPNGGGWKINMLPQRKEECQTVKNLLEKSGIVTKPQASHHPLPSFDPLILSTLSFPNGE